MSEPLSKEELHKLVDELNGLCRVQNWRAAEPFARQLIAAGDTRPEVRNALGACLSNTARGPEAIREFRKALIENPTSAYFRAHLIMAMDVQETTTFEQFLLERERFYAVHCKALHEAAKPHTNDPDPERPVRVGYVSGDYRFHSAPMVFGHILMGHLAGADVHPVLYSMTPHNLYDGVTDAMQAHLDWRDVYGVSDDELAERIRDDAIDILVDLGGYTMGPRLTVFARKPAPVQLSGWGYAHGNALACFDGYLADKFTVPERMRRAPLERVVDLPSIVSYEPPSYPIAVNERPTDALFVFGVIQRAVKIDDRAVRCWAEILRRVPGSRLVMKSGTYFEDFRARVRTLLGDCADRVDFVGETGHPAHLEAHHNFDLMLDPFGQSGGVTTLESAWMGVPTINLLGTRPATRISGSIMDAVGLGSFNAATRGEYVDLAVKWATSGRGELASIRQNLRNTLAASPICVGYVPAVEAAYRTLWREWCLKARP